MRLFFHLLYHSFAWTYDLVASVVSFGRWKGWAKETLKLINGPRVLELGFGPGHLQAGLHAAGMEPFGLDESSQMARQRAAAGAERHPPAPGARSGAAPALSDADL